MTLARLWLDSKRMVWSLFRWNRFYGTFYSKTLITTKPTSNISSFGSLSVQIISCIIRLRMALFVSSKRFYRMVRQYFRPCACRVMAQKDKASIRIQDRHYRYGSFPIGGPQGHAVRNSNMLDNYDGSWPPWSDWVCLPEAEVAPLALSRRAAPAMDREYKDIFPSKRFPRTERDVKMTGITNVSILSKHNTYLANTLGCTRVAIILAIGATHWRVTYCANAITMQSVAITQWQNRQRKEQAWN